MVGMTELVALLEGILAELAMTDQSATAFPATAALETFFTMVLMEGYLLWIAVWRFGQHFV